MPEVPPWSVLLIAFGIPALLWPYEVARVYETIHAIGRKPAGPVEPADWYVSLTRIGGAAFLVVGILTIVAANT